MCSNIIHQYVNTKLYKINIIIIFIYLFLLFIWMIYLIN